MEGVGGGIDGWNQLCDDNETRSDRGWVAQRPLNKKLWRLIRQDFFYRTDVLPVAKPTVSKH